MGVFGVMGVRLGRWRYMADVDLGKHVYVCGCSCEAGGEGGKSVLPAELLAKSKHSHHINRHMVCIKQCLQL
jgi:hypothetical protein